MTDDEKAARARLGEWCAAAEKRWWELDDDPGAEDDERYAVELYEDGFNMLEASGFCGAGPTLAAAILDAIAKVAE